MKTILTILFALGLAACSQAPTTTMDRALERAEEVQVEQIDKNRYLASSSSSSVEYAKSQALRTAYETCMRQNLAAQILAQGRITGEKGFVYATQFACVSGLTAKEQEIIEKYPK